MQINKRNHLYFFQLILLYLIVFCCLFIGLFFHVWQQIEIVKLDFEVKGLVREKMKLVLKQDYLKLEKASLESMDRLEWKARKVYGFRIPPQDKVIWVGKEDYIGK